MVLTLGSQELAVKMSVRSAVICGLTGAGGDDDLLTSGSLTQLVRSYWLSAEGLSSLLCVPLCRAA